MNWKPFDVNGAVFRPLGKILMVEEPDFGCEGAPDGCIYGTVVIQERDAERPRTVKIPEHTLFSGHMDDGMWYGSLAGQLVLIKRDMSTVILPNDEELAWLKQL